jgi:recombinational DNA repair protein RecR
MIRDEPWRIIDDEEESNWAYFIVLGMLDSMYEQDIFFQFKFTKLLRRLEEDYKNEVIQKLAFNKIKRNQIFILGLSMKLSMRDCGIDLTPITKN